MSLNPLADGIVGAVTSVVNNVIERIIPDPVKAAEAKLAVAQLQQTGELAELAAATDIVKGQLAINQEEAKSTNWLIAGARPFIMWGCGFSMLYVGLFEPMFRFIAIVMFHYTGAFPVIDTTITTQVLFGLLGLGGYRTIEKLKNVEGNR